MADLSKLSDADLEALIAGDLTKVSDAGLSFLTSEDMTKAVSDAANAEVITHKDEAHPDISAIDRFLFTNSTQPPEKKLKTLQKTYPNIEFKLDMDGGVIARTKGAKESYVLDPSFGSTEGVLPGLKEGIQDLLDLGDVAVTGAGSILGGRLGSVRGAAAGGAAAGRAYENLIRAGRAARSGEAVESDLGEDISQVGKDYLSGFIGEALPAVAGRAYDRFTKGKILTAPDTRPLFEKVGAFVKGIPTKEFWIGAPRKELAREGIESMSERIGGAVSGVPAERIQATKKHLAEIKRLVGLDKEAKTNIKKLGPKPSEEAIAKEMELIETPLKDIAKDSHTYMAGGLSAIRQNLGRDYGELLRRGTENTTSLEELAQPIFEMKVRVLKTLKEKPGDVVAEEQLAVADEALELIFGRGAGDKDIAKVPAYYAKEGAPAFIPDDPDYVPPVSQYPIQSYVYKTAEKNVGGNLGLGSAEVVPSKTHPANADEIFSIKKRFEDKITYGNDKQLPSFDRKGKTYSAKGNEKLFEQVAGKARARLDQQLGEDFTNVKEAMHEVTKLEGIKGTIAAQEPEKRTAAFLAKYYNPKAQLERENIQRFDYLLNRYAPEYQAKTGSPLTLKDRADLFSGYDFMANTPAYTPSMLGVTSTSISQAKGKIGEAIGEQARAAVGATGEQLKSFVPMGAFLANAATSPRAIRQAILGAEKIGKLRNYVNQTPEVKFGSRLPIWALMDQAQQNMSQEQ